MLQVTWAISTSDHGFGFVEFDGLSGGETMYPIFGTTSSGTPVAQVKSDAVLRLQKGPKDDLYVYFHAVGSDFDIASFDELPAWSFRTPSHLLDGISSELEFRGYASDLADHYVALRRLDRKQYDTSEVTPWRHADRAIDYGDGVVLFTGSSHGGLRVSEEQNLLIPEPYRNENGWYEKNTDAEKVTVSFPDLFTKFEVRRATAEIINWHPGEYEEVTGDTILPGQSHTKDKLALQSDNANNWVAGYAVRTGEFEGMVVCVATLGGEEIGTNPSRPQRVCLCS